MENIEKEGNIGTDRLLAKFRRLPENAGENLFLIAPPGSGKTSLAIERYCELLRSGKSAHLSFRSRHYLRKFTIKFKNPHQTSLLFFQQESIRIMTT